MQAEPDPLRSRPPAEPAPRQAFLFADIAGFTSLTEAHGDERAAEVVDHFCEHAAGLIARLGGEQVKTIGDAVMLRTESAATAVRLGIDLAHHEMARDRHPRVGVGIAWGPAAERGGDWIGSTVNVAARLSELAEGAEVLISAAGRRAAGEIEGIDFRSRGPVTLRGLHEPLEVYEADCRDRAAALYLDPVCRMALDPRGSHLSAMHRETVYRFCSERCLRAFRSNPDAFTGPASPQR